MNTPNEPTPVIEPIQTKPESKPKGLIWTLVIILVLIIGVGVTELVNIPMVS